MRGLTPLADSETSRTAAVTCARRQSSHAAGAAFFASASGAVFPVSL